MRGCIVPASPNPPLDRKSPSLYSIMRSSSALHEILSLLAQICFRSPVPWSHGYIDYRPDFGILSSLLWGDSLVKGLGIPHNKVALFASESNEFASLLFEEFHFFLVVLVNLIPIFGSIVSERFHEFLVVLVGTNIQQQRSITYEKAFIHTFQ